MAYLLLVVENADERRARPVEEGRRAMDRMLRYAEALKARGVFRACDALEGDARAARVTHRNGKRAVVDGPFTESKEIVGGYFLIDCASREEAVALASECPATEWATIEVREIGPCWEGSQP